MRHVHFFLDFIVKIADLDLKLNNMYVEIEENINLWIAY